MIVLRYASDLHLQLRSTINHVKLQPLWKIKKNNDTKLYLALLGDIGNPFNDNLNLFFFQKIHPIYEKNIYLPCNHEYYNYKIIVDNSKDAFDAELKKNM